MNTNIDWTDVENKISLILYRFQNLSAWHEDLAQELRIHAYYVSDNYYDLYRKAIDFWRKIQTRQAPEIPYFDLEILGSSYTDKHDDQFEDIIALIRKELNLPGHNKWDTNKIALAKQLIDMILEDIDPTKVESKYPRKTSNLNHYINSRLNLSWVAEETGVGYKRIVAAMKLLEDIVRGLAAMHRIELPSEYFTGYYEENDK